jgi:hypothetical protein
MLPHLEATLRIGGLIIGMLVGLATLISVLHDIRKKQKELIYKEPLMRVSATAARPETFEMPRTTTGT